MLLIEKWVAQLLYWFSGKQCQQVTIYYKETCTFKNQVNVLEIIFPDDLL